MAQNIKLKRSSVSGKVPTTSQLEAGEIAINTVDGKLYFERDDASIQTIVTTNAVITGSLNINGPITGSDVKINGWGSVSASLASIEAGVATQNLQDVTDNGSITTTNIAVGGLTSTVNGIGITGVFRTTNGANSFIIESSGSGGTLPGLIQVELRDFSTSLNSALILYGGTNGDVLSFLNDGGTRLGLSGSTLNQTYIFENGANLGTGSFSWNNSTPFIQKIGGGITQFLGNTTTATTASFANQALSSSFATTANQALSSSFATTASYVATASYTPTLQQVTNVGNTTTNSIFLTGLYNNTLRIGLEGGATSPAPSQSVGLGLHGSQIYWSGSTPDGGGATPSTNLKAVEQFQYDNNNISIGGKLFVFNGVSIGTGSFHSVHCDYTLFGTNESTNNVHNVRAGTLIVAVDDANRISSTEYSTAMTSGSQEIDPVNFNIERVSGALQCWISNTNNHYNVCKSRITVM